MDSVDNEMPDLMNLQNMPTNTIQRIDTDVLDPVVISDTFCRFTLINKGFLNHASRVTLALKTGNNAFYPLNIGVDALISRAVLKFNNRTVSEISDFGHLRAIKSSFLANQFNKEREQFVSGKSISHNLVYGKTDATRYEADNIALDNGMVQNKNSNDFMKVRPELDINNGPIFSVLLSDLFPFFDKMKTFPLYACEDQINIELHFSDNVNRAIKSTVGPATFEIDTNEVKMVADYIFYPEEIMEQQLKNMNGTKWNYQDYRLSKFSVTDGDIGTGTRRNIGGAGLRVSKIFSILSANNASTGGTLLSDYTGEYGETNATNKINIYYNNKDLFTFDKSNPAALMHHLSEAGGSMVHINKKEYSNSGAWFNASQKFEGYEMNANLAGKLFYTGFNLIKNERINEKGIEYVYSNDDIAGGTYTQRVYLEIARYAILENGHLTCYYY
tara:strand:- start:835 stop:2166 length:1332 start_codon:yes stop_codon:yes gene_type:complete